MTNPITITPEALDAVVAATVAKTLDGLGLYVRQRVAAEWLGVTPKTVRNRLRAGKLKRIGAGVAASELIKNPS